MVIGWLETPQEKNLLQFFWDGLKLVCYRPILKHLAQANTLVHA
jgi:hypothetical protein